MASCCFPQINPFLLITAANRRSMSWEIAADLLTDCKEGEIGARERERERESRHFLTPCSSSPPSPPPSLPPPSPPPDTQLLLRLSSLQLTSCKGNLCEISVLSQTFGSLTTENVAFGESLLHQKHGYMSLCKECKTKPEKLPLPEQLELKQ